jgi:Protein of unknown function (DUF3300)
MNGNAKQVAWCGRRPHAWVAVLLTLVFLVESCKSGKGPPPVETAQPPSTAQGIGATPGTPPPQGAPASEGAPAVAAPAVTQASWSPDALEELLAPIALYPDQLLGQILAASVNSQEVMDGGNWLLQNQNLTGNDLDAAAQKAGFGPAMRALLQYPTVVDMMCQEIDWTGQVGSAFNSDQKSVLDAVQRLRKEAADVGNLKSTPQQTVSTKTEGGNVYVEVKPADPKIVYVPQYDPQAVYTTPPPAQAAPAAPATTNTTTNATTTTTTEKEKDGVSTGTAVAVGLIAFAAGVAIGSSMNDDYYYPSWGHGAVYYGPRPYYPAAYVYRPVYGPAFRPAYGYRSPAGYRYNYNNVRVNNNVVVNNKNYYNRFNNNQNLRTGGTRSPIAATQPRAGQQPRVGQTGPGARSGTSQNWKGQSNYAGARRGEANTLPRETSRDSRPGSASAAPRAGQVNRPNASTRETPAANRDATRTPTRTADASPRVDRGYGDAPRAENRQANASAPPRAENRQANASAPPRPENRQPTTSTPTRPANRETNASAPSRPQPSAEGLAPKRDNAFSGGQKQGDGNFQRAASARGNASVGSRQTSGGHVRKP